MLTDILQLMCFT